MKGPKDWSRSPAPLGQIRIHGGVRRVKVSMDGPKSRRWMDYALHWWLANKGQVPFGKRVCHLDGNTLNDDPSNLAAVSPGDVAFLWHDRDPAGSRRNYAKCRAATAECNRIRGAQNRLRNLLPTRWYGVDPELELIYNQPRRQRWQVLSDHGVAIDAGGARKAISAALGFPDLTCAQACMLSILSDAGELSGVELRKRVQSLRDRYGWKPAAIARCVMFSEISQLPAEWITRRRRSGRRQVYAIGAPALEARQVVCRIVPMRGAALGWPPFDGFSRIDPEECPAKALNP